MSERTCDAATRRGRARKADEFRLAAEVIEEYAGSDDDLNDAYVTLCVHAGIATADVVCCARLGVITKVNGITTRSPSSPARRRR